jgi:hypothetical protein
MVVANRVVMVVVEVMVMIVVMILVVMMATLTTTASTGKVNKNYLESVGNNKGCMQNFAQKCSGSSY